MLSGRRSPAAISVIFDPAYRTLCANYHLSDPGRGYSPNLFQQVDRGCIRAFTWGPAQAGSRIATYLIYGGANHALGISFFGSPSSSGGWNRLPDIRAVAVAIIICVAAFLLLRVSVKFFHFRGVRQVLCPETGSIAIVRINAVRAAVSSAVSDPHLRVSDCSLWPERQGCREDYVCMIS
jgi:hypothetical protein